MVTTSLKNAPIVDGHESVVGHEVAVKMMMNTGGYNAGETARFPASVAADMIERGEAALAGVQPTHARFAKKVQRGLTLIHRALDAREAISVQLLNLQEAINDAIQAVEDARNHREDRGASFTVARETLEAADAQANDEAVGVIKTKKVIIDDAKKDYDIAAKSVKRARDKDKANKAVADAEIVISNGDADLLGIQNVFNAASKIRNERIDVARRAERAAIDEDVDTGMAELEELFKEIK